MLMDEGWRIRLAEAVQESKARGLSAREISLRAGKGPGYVHSILKQGSDPSIANLMSLCRVMNVSFSRIVAGFDIDTETERLLLAINGNKDRLKAVLQLLAEPGAGPQE